MEHFEKDGKTDMIKLTIETLEKRLGVKFDVLPLARALTRFPHLYAEGPWLAGGAVRRTFAGESLSSDFDFFFKNQDQFKAFKDELEHSPAIKRGENDRNTSFALPSEQVDIDEVGEFKRYEPELKLQLINFQYYGSIEEVLDSFDFTITQFGFDGDHFYTSDFALWDLARKRLVVNKVTYATASLRRMLKYADQGFTLCSGASAQFLEAVAADPQIIEPDIKYID